MILIDWIIVSLVVRSLLNEKIAEQIVESLKEFAIKGLERAIGENAYNSIKSVVSKVSRRLVKDKVWRDVSKISKDVFIYALGDGITKKCAKV